MHANAILLSAVVAITGLPSALSAQQPAVGMAGGQAPRTVTMRPIGPIIARAAEPMAGPVAIRALSDGRVLVSDPTGRRLLLFDSSLAHFAVVVDTSGTAARGYGRGTGNGRLIAYLGDSTLFVDGGSLALVVIDPSGGINRVISVPNPDQAMLWNSRVAAIGFDMHHGIVYAMQRPGIPGSSDSAWIVRADLLSHHTDTVAALKIRLGVVPACKVTPEGKQLCVSPMRVSATPDDWAMVADGSVAVVRGGDYHVDWIDPMGVTTASAKIAHQWTRRSDDEKAAMIAALQKGADSANAANAQYNATSNRPMLYEVASSVNDVPDYPAPFSYAGTRGDFEGNLWILTKPADATSGGATYDVVNRGGVLIDRVQLPGACTLVGFGPGVAYVTSREGAHVVLARARIR